MVEEIQSVHLAGATPHWDGGYWKGETEWDGGKPAMDGHHSELPSEISSWCDTESMPSSPTLDPTLDPTLECAECEADPESIPFLGISSRPPKLMHACQRCKNSKVSCVSTQRPCERCVRLQASIPNHASHCTMITIFAHVPSLPPPPPPSHRCHHHQHRHHHHRNHAARHAGSDSSRASYSQMPCDDEQPRVKKQSCVACKGRKARCVIDNGNTSCARCIKFGILCTRAAPKSSKGKKVTTSPCKKTRRGFRPGTAPCVA